MKNNDRNELGSKISFFVFIGFILVLIFWNNIASMMAGKGWNPQRATSCKDVTSYDYDWNNDMLCTRSDGTTFYTSYEGARQAEAN